MGWWSNLDKSSSGYDGCWQTVIMGHYMWSKLDKSWFALGVVVKWSKVLIAIPLPLMVWSTLALGTYQLRFVSGVFLVIFSFVHFISLYSLSGLHAFRKPLLYNMYLFNLWIANHILIIIIIIIIMIIKMVAGRLSSWPAYDDPS